MPAPLSKAIRGLVIRLYARGDMTYDEVAELAEASRASVSRYLRLHRVTGTADPKTATGGYAAGLTGSEKEVRALVNATPDATLEVLAATWSKERPAMTVSRQTMGRMVQRLGFTLKKSPSRHRS